MTAQALTRDVSARPEWVAVLGHAAPATSASALRLGSSAATLGVAIEGDASSGRSIATDRWCGLLFDGVLYNRAEVATSLGVRGSSTPDAKLLLVAYERWGAELTRHVKGVFSLVVWDAMQRRLLAVRDPLGAHPLFYATGRDNRLLVSSSIDALVSHPWVDPSLNRAALADHLCHRWAFPDETFYSAVKRVPGGCRLISKDGATRVERYWDPAPEGEPVDWITESDLEEFDERLDTAVERALSLGRTGIFLSGGLDSISVAAVATDVARKLQKPDPIALSLGFPHPECNEELVQRGVAGTLGLEQEFVPFFEAIPSRGLLAPALELAQTSPAPLINTWNPAYMELALRGKRRGVQVILTGAGGDEWLTVSPYLSADLLKSGDVPGFVRMLALWKRSYKLTRFRLLRGNVWTFGIRPLAGAALHHLAPGRWRANRLHRLLKSTNRPWVGPGRELSAELERRAEHLLSPPAPKRGFYFQEVRASLDHPLTSMELEEMFHVSSRLGMRYHHPYWDADVVDMLYRTPPHLLMREGRAKGLVRGTVARRFPSLGLDRQKKVAASGFYESVLRDEVPRLWQTTGGAPGLGSLGIIDTARTDDMVRGALETFDRRSLRQVWDVIKLEAWVRSHMTGNPADTTRG